MLLLFVPDSEVVYRNDSGAELAANADRFVSRLAAERYVGYLQSQEAGMTGQAGAHTNRPELVAKHGYDTKFAMHALRLGIQGIEILTTGHISLPVPDHDRAYLRAVRRGEVPLGEAVDSIDRVKRELNGLRASTRLPDQPDRAWVNAWLHRSYTTYWQQAGPGAG